MKKSPVVLSIAFLLGLEGCVVVPHSPPVRRTVVTTTTMSAPAAPVQQVPAPQAAPQAPAAQQNTQCQQVAWEAATGRWVCTDPAASTTTVTTETTVINGVTYGIVGGYITGHWTGNLWYYGVPRGFVMPFGFRIAPHGYYGRYRSGRGYSIPHGFHGGGRGRR